MTHRRYVQSPTKSPSAKKALPFTHVSYGLSSSRVHELKIKEFRKCSIWHARLLLQCTCIKKQNKKGSTYRDLVIHNFYWEQLPHATLRCKDKLGVLLHSGSEQIDTLARYCVNFSHLPMGSFTAVAPLAAVYLHKWLLIKSLETDGESLWDLNMRLRDSGCEFSW